MQSKWRDKLMVLFAEVFGVLIATIAVGVFLFFYTGDRLVLGSFWAPFFFTTISYWLLFRVAGAMEIGREIKKLYSQTFRSLMRLSSVIIHYRTANATVLFLLLTILKL